MKKNIFWKNKIVFISGVAGFVGSNLAKNLVECGARIIGLTQNKKISSLLYYENIDKKSDLIFGNITDKELLASIFLKYKIDTVCHSAAYKHVPLIEKNPIQGIYNNVFSTFVCCTLLLYLSTLLFPCPHDLEIFRPL